MAIVVKKPLTVFHINEEIFSIGSKNRDTGKYPNSSKWLWGNILTNKATRTSGRYAIMMDPQGVKAHYLTKTMFKRLCNFCEHTYMPVVADEDVRAFVRDSEHLTLEQLRRVMEAIKGHTMYDEVCDC